MRRPVRWLLVGVAAVAGLAIAAIATLPRIVETPRVQSLITASASQALARPVRFRSLSVSFLPYPAARLGGLEVAEDPAFGPGPFLKLDEADLRLKLWPLLRGRIEFATLVLKRPTIALIQAPDGRWNFAGLGGTREATAAPRPSRSGGAGATSTALVSRVVIDHGLVTHETRGSRGAASRGRLEQVDMTISTRAGVLSFGGSARVMPGDVAVKVSGGTLALGGARAMTDAGLRAQVQLDAADVGPVVAAVLGPEPVVSGAVTGQFKVTGSLGRPRVAGEVEVRSPEIARTSPGCPAPKRRRLSLATVKAGVVWDDGRLLVQPLTTGIGGGTIASRVAMAPAAHAQAEVPDLVLKAIPLERVLVDFLCEGYAVVGPLDLTGVFVLSPTDPLRTLSGAGRLRIGPGKVVGAGALSVLGGLARLAGGMASRLGIDPSPSAATAPLEFDAITAGYEVRHGVVTTRDLLYTGRPLNVKVAGSYALPTGRVDLDVALDYGGGPLLGKVTGTAAAPSIRLTPVAVLRQADPERAERRLKDLLKKFH